MNSETPSFRLAAIGTLMSCIALLVALPAKSLAAGYWRINGDPQVIERLEAPPDGGGEWKIVSAGGDNVRFDFFDRIHGTHTGLYFKWSGPTIIVPGEVPPVSVSYEVTGPRMGQFSVGFFVPGRNAVETFLRFELGQNSVPAGRIVNTTIKAPLQSGDRDVIYQAGLTGGLRYGVKIPYRWIEGTPPPTSANTPPGGGPAVAAPGGGPTVAPPASTPGTATTPSGRPGTSAVGTGRDDAAGRKPPGTGGPLSGCAREAELYTNNNPAGVSNGPTQPTRFSLNAPTQVSYLLTYHWNNGRGQPPGSIGLQHQDGTRYGPWPAAGTPAGNVPNAYWIVRPQVVVKPGTYTVLDSHAASWAQNGQSNSQGIVVVRGCSVR